MTNWREVAESAPEFAARVRAAFEAHKYKTIATVRSDGSPRISGIEADFVGDDLWFGSMPGAVKAKDLLRDPRFALHSASGFGMAGDPANTPGDAKVSGRAVEVTDRSQVVPLLTARGFEADAFSGSHFFRVDVHEVVLTRLDGSGMVIELWRPDQPLRRFNR
jgi:hypothetical protein